MSERTSPAQCSRRRLLETGAGAAALAVGSTGTATAQGEPYDGYLSDANLFEGQTGDYTGSDEVTVDVGAGDNNLAFRLPAIQIDPGTTVAWEWTGAGGGHNVVHAVEESAQDEQAFNSGDPVAEEGETFEHTFEEAGVYKYYCNPHRASGMKGVVAVGDTAEGEVVAPGELLPDDDGGDGNGSESAANELALTTLLAMVVLGLLSPIVFFLIVRRKMSPPPRTE